MRRVWRKIRAWADGILEERRRHVEEHGEDPTVWG